jgi:hypothetical protein
MLKHTISQKESAFGANSGPEAPHSNFMPPLRPLTEHRTQGAGAPGSSIQNREGRVFYLFLLPGRCVLSFARKPTGCCPVADLPRNACLDTRKHGMTRICFILLSALALAFANGEAWAQAWPTRPIRAIVAFFRRRHRRRYGACGLRSALEPAPSAGGR